MSSHPSPRYVPSFLSRLGFSFPAARRFSSNVAHSRSRAFLYSICLRDKVPARTSMHSVRLEPTILILVGTRTTYQATGVAVLHFVGQIAIYTSRRSSFICRSMFPGWRCCARLVCRRAVSYRSHSATCAKAVLYDTVPNSPIIIYAVLLCRSHMNIYLVYSPI